MARLKFVQDQEIETDGIIGLVQEEGLTVRVKYFDHEVRVKGVTTTEMWARINQVKAAEQIAKAKKK